MARTVHTVGTLVRTVLALVVLTALIVGLPSGLVTYIGWPLPHQVPSWDEIQATLLAPMSPQFLLDLLACILWPLWARFTVDVLAAISDAMRAAPWPHPTRGVRPGPLHAIAGVLVGAIMVSILGSRTPSPHPLHQGTATATGYPITVATALYPPTTTDPTPVGQRPVVVSTRLHTADTPPDTVIVQGPEHGVYDSLWRIAQRLLGDGNRWPDIWVLNRGTVQVDGRVFTNPNLIQPGWTLRLPEQHDTPPPSPVRPSPVQPSPPSHDASPGQQNALSTPTLAPSTTQPAPAVHDDPVPSAPSVEPGTGITLPTGAFVGIGLAALITVALFAVKLRRRRHYRPGAVEPDDASTAPVVRALRIAHDTATLPHDDDGSPLYPTPTPGTLPPELAARDRAQTTARTVVPATPHAVVGLRDGHTVALDLAQRRGLGLTGAGAPAAARALIISLLARTTADGKDAVMIVPAADAHTLLGADIPQLLPPRLRIVDDLTTALDNLEAELVTRARCASDQTDPDTPADRRDGAALVLVATPMPEAERRLQAILDNGSAFGLAGVLLGQWRPGDTIRIREDGTIRAASSSVAEQLLGARLFNLPEPDTTDLLTLLGAAHCATSPDTDPYPAPAEDEYDFITTPPATLRGTPETDPCATPSGVMLDLPEQRDTGSATVMPSPVDLPDQSGSTSMSSLPADTQRDPVDAARPAAVAVALRNENEPPATAELAGPTPSATPDIHRGSQRTPLHFQVLGRLQLTWTHPRPTELIDTLAPRQREILVYLALHPHGSRRDTLTTALWPDAPADRPFNSFHATLSQMRRALRTATDNTICTITVNSDGHYGLDQSLVTVDLWQLQDALTRGHRAPTTAAQIATLGQAVDLYSGDLAEDITADWIEAPREALRRDVLDALSALIRTISKDAPEQTLTLLEQARTLDPYNEAIYRDIMRTQARLDQHDSIPRTLTLLTNTLAHIDQRPTADTLALANALQKPRNTHRLRNPETSEHPN